MKRNRTASLVRGLDRALILVATIGLVAMMVHISLDILSSLILNAPIATTSAIVTNYYMIAAAFLPIMAAEFRNSHIGVNLVTERLPEGARRGLETAIMALTALVYVLLTAASWQQAVERFHKGDFLMEQTTRILLWPSYYMLPVGFGAIALLLVLKVALRLTGRSDAALQDAAPLAPETAENGRV